MAGKDTIPSAPLQRAVRGREELRLDWEVLRGILLEPAQ